MRPEYLAPLLVVMTAIIAGMHAVDATPVGVFYDDALYVILGKSLMSGQGFRYLNLPGAPVATHYPPGYPALLAVLWRISPEFPENIALFKTANAMLLGVVAFFVYRFATTRLEMPWGAAVFAAIAGTVAIPALVLSSAVMSEVLFLALLLPFLVKAEAAVRRDGVFRAALVGGGAALLLYFRAHALVLIPAVALAYLINRKRREAIVATLVGAALVSPWFMWVAAHDGGIPAPLRGSYGSYGAWLSDGVRAEGLGLLLTATRENVATINAIVERSFGIAPNVVLRALAVVAVLLLCVAGSVVWFKRARLTLLFMALYMTLVVIWPFSPLRFVWGVWPLFVLMMVSGVRYLLRFDSASLRWQGRMRVLGAAAGTLALIGALNFNVRGYANAWWASVARSVGPRIHPQLVWVASRTVPTDVVAADDEGAVYLYTGRRAVPSSAFTAAQFLRSTSPAENAESMAIVLRAFAPTYVVAWAVPTTQAAMLLSQRRPPLLTPIDSIPGGRVFRRSATEERTR